MAGVWVEPFDYWTVAQIGRVYNGVVQSGTYALGAYGPGGGAGFRFSGVLQDEIRRTSMVWVNGNTAIWEFDFRVSAYPSIENRLIAVLDGATFTDNECQCELHLNLDGKISAHRGHLSTDALLGTSTYVLPLNTLVHFSVKFVIDNAVGAVTVDVYPVGSSTPTSVLALTNKDTQTTAAAQWNGFVLGAATNGTTDFANVVGMDGSGSRNNDRIGPCIVLTRRPDADGTHHASTPSTGTDRSAMVDDTTADDDGTYNTLVGSGDTDTFDVEDVGTTNEVLFSALVWQGKTTSGAGTIGLKPVAREGATDTIGSTVLLTAGYTGVTTPKFYQTAPSTTPWTAALWNAMQWGYQLNQAGTARVTQLVTIAVLRRITVDDEPTFTNGPQADIELQIGLTWMIVTTRSGAQYVWSDRPLPDPSTYYLGWKEPRVMQWGAIRRAMSDFLTGQYETTDFKVTLTDTDRLLRQLDADAELVNATVAVYMNSDSGRRALQPAKTVYRGVIRDAAPQGTLRYTLTIKDPFAESFSSSSASNLNPRRVVTQDDFPNCATDLVSSSAESYVVNGAVASGLSDIPVRAGHGVFAEGDKVKFGAGADVYTVSAPSSCFQATGIDAETSISISSALVSGLSDGDAITQVPSHQVTPSAGVRVPFVYSYITDRNVTGGIDAGDGQGPVLYVGDRVLADGKTYGEFLWAGHACYAPGGKPFSMLYFWNEALDDLIGGYPDLGTLATAAGVGGRIALPGYGNWTTTNGIATAYRDFNGRRCTVLYLRGIFRDWALGITMAPANLGGEPFAVAAYGIEDVGDSSGALITNGLQQYKHIVKNWCPPTGAGYQSGAWLSSPTFADDPTLPMIDEASFDAADAQSAVYVADGFRGDFIVGANNEAITTRDLLARLNLSFGVDCGFNRKTQFFVSMVNTDIGSTALKTTLSYVRDIFAGTFEIEPVTRELYTAIDYRHTQDYFNRAQGGWRSTTSGVTETENAAATSTYGSKTVSPQLLMYMVRGQNRASDPSDYARGTLTAAAVLALRLARASAIQHLPKLKTGPAGFNYELADVVPITHYEGLSSAGWTDRPVRIERTETDPWEFTEAIECYDLDPMVS